MTVKPQAHNYLKDIKSYKPGKDRIEGVQEDVKVIKLSSNENPLGSSLKAITDYKEHAGDLPIYADGACTNLRQKIAQKYNIDSAKIVCGAGSDEILYMLASAYAGVGDEVIHSKHGFLMYGISAKRVGASVVVVDEKNLKADVDEIIAAVTDKTKIIFLANPNNPTGSYLTNNEVEKLINNIRQDVLIVLDHAYDEYVIDKKDYPDAIRLVNENKNVIMTRTFSKIHGLASLRIGWCYADVEVIDVLNKVRGPFNVGGPAQVAAAKAITDEDFMRNSAEHNLKWLDKYFDFCQGLNNIKAYDSVANFILFNFGSEKNAEIANEEFLKNGVIVRKVAAYLLPDCLRITVGSDQDNEKVIKLLKQIDQMINKA